MGYIWYMAQRVRRERIAELVRERGLSLSAFGRAIGRTRQGAAAVLSGQFDPQITTLCRIADLFGLPVCAFFEGAPPCEHTRPKVGRKRRMKASGAAEEAPPSEET